MNRVLIDSFAINLKSAFRNLKFAILHCTLLFALCASAEAQQPAKVPRIGYLSSTNSARESARFEAIRLALRELGYIEGQNIATEYRYAEGKQDRNAPIAAELARLKVDVIVVAGGDEALRAAINATKTIPIVMVGGGADPVEAGVVESLARPGGNVTGLTNLSRGLSGKRLELLKEAVPKVSRVAVLYNPTAPSAIELKGVQSAGRALRLSIQAWEVRAADDFEKVFAVQSNERPDGLYVIGGALMRSNEKRIVGLALKSRLPSVYNNRAAVDAGGFMFYGADEAESYRRVAYFVDRILKGTKPADLPVEQPTKFEFVINLKTAKQIGVTIPPVVALSSGQSHQVIFDFRLGAKDMTKRSRPFLWFRSDNRKSAIQNPKWWGIFALTFTFALGGAVALAQQPGKVLRIGFLDASTASGSAVRLEAFRQELRKLGWIEGKNITIEYRFAEQKPERVPELAADLVRLKVDLIVVSGTPQALAAKKATTTIPIVMANVGDPVGSGLVASLARPGDNVTGLASLSPELNSKRLEILKDAVPKLARVGLLRQAGATDVQLKEIRPAALALKLKLEEIDTQPDAKGLESAFKTAKQKQVNAIMTTSTTPFFAERKRIVELAVKYRLPAISEGVC